MEIKELCRDRHPSCLPVIKRQIHSNAVSGDQTVDGFHEGTVSL